MQKLSDRHEQRLAMGAWGLIVDAVLPVPIVFICLLLAPAPRCHKDRCFDTAFYGECQLVWQCVCDSRHAMKENDKCGRRWFTRGALRITEKTLGLEFCEFEPALIELALIAALLGLQSVHALPHIGFECSSQSTPSSFCTSCWSSVASPSSVSAECSCCSDLCMHHSHCLGNRSCETEALIKAACVHSVVPHYGGVVL